MKKNPQPTRVTDHIECADAAMRPRPPTLANVRTELHMRHGWRFWTIDSGLSILDYKESQCLHRSGAGIDRPFIEVHCNWQDIACGPQQKIQKQKNQECLHQNIRIS